MFIDIRAAHLPRAIAILSVLDVEVNIIVTDGGFMLLDPKVLLLGVICYLTLGQPGRGPLPSREREG